MKTTPSAAAAVRAVAGGPAGDRLAARYARAAATWHDRVARLGYFAAYRQIGRAALQQLAPAPGRPPLRVLDAGAGTGGFALSFAGCCPAPLAVDLLDTSAAMLERACRNLAEAGIEARAIHALLGPAAVAPGGYDVVLCSHLIEHLPDTVGGLAVLHRALRPGGVLLLVASRPHWCTRLLQLTWRHRAFPDPVLAGLLAQAGFTRVTRIAFDAGPPARTSRGHIAWR